MARFRGTVKGNRTEASRLGHPATGLTVTANGWDAGIKVEAGVDPDTEQDRFTVWLTPGSNGAGFSTLLGTFQADDVKRTEKDKLVTADK